MKWHIHCWHGIGEPFQKTEWHGKLVKDKGRFQLQECCKCGKITAAKL